MNKSETIEDMVDALIHAAAADAKSSRGIFDATPRHLRTARDYVIARFAEVTAQRDDLLRACEEARDAITIMGQLKCFNELGGFDADPELEQENIDKNWLEFVPICEADAYRACCAAIAKARVEVTP